MRFIALILLAGLASGCAGNKKIELQNLEQSASYVVQDSRPEEEKVDKTFSLFIGSESYGIYRRGDKRIEPSPVRIFQHKIYEKYSSKAELPKVNIHHLIVYLNLKSSLRGSVLGGVFGGAIGAAFVSSTQKYGVDGTARIISLEEFNGFEEEYKRALYTEDENPDKVSVYKVYLDAEIDGKRTLVTTMTPAILPEQKDKNTFAVALETAMAYFLDQY